VTAALKVVLIEELCECLQQWQHCLAVCLLKETALKSVLFISCKCTGTFAMKSFWKFRVTVVTFCTAIDRDGEALSTIIARSRDYFLFHQ